MINFHKFESIRIIEIKRKRLWGGMALPPLGLFVDDFENKNLLKHEFGHWLQYKTVGFLKFYLHYGFPSFFNTLENWYELKKYNEIRFSVPHKYHFTEIDANKRAIKYFKGNLNKNYFATTAHTPKKKMAQRFAMYFYSLFVIDN